MDELNLDLSGIEDPVTARVADLINLSEALDKSQNEVAQNALKAGLAFVLEDLKRVVYPPVAVQGDNIIQFPGGRDVH
ncbi:MULTISPECIES: hypothetical protein [Pseudomonas]|uniref:hypothetical protein n=1 Tax=Pseudomonas TaxID=286 RepID=UPI001BAEFC70|nr:hypothetical protein [Pseudomonas putida]QUG89084.1 hypothetical protein GR140_10020 [Pseudomonas putida]